MPRKQSWLQASPAGKNTLQYLFIIHFPLSVTRKDLFINLDAFPSNFIQKPWRVVFLVLWMIKYTAKSNLQPQNSMLPVMKGLNLQ